MASGRSVETADDATCYVRTIEPNRWNGKTMVMVHGAWHTGDHYVATLDGRPGWAKNFAEAGYRVLVTDCPGTGRSPAVADRSRIGKEFICAGLGRVIDSVAGPVDLLVHSMSGPYGFRLLETHGEFIDHLVAVAPGGPPHLGSAPDEWEDLGATVRTVYGSVERTFPKAGWTYGSREFVVGHCIGASNRFPAVDPDDYLATLSPIWSSLSVELLDGFLDPPNDSPDFTDADVMVMIGSNDLGHPVAGAVQIVDWLAAHGADAELCALRDLGIEGNGHMLMLEDNSQEIATVIVDLLES